MPSRYEYTPKKIRPTARATSPESSFMPLLNRGGGSPSGVAWFTPGTPNLPGRATPYLNNFFKLVRAESLGDKASSSSRAIA
jgi:hypothetical protein